MRTELKYVVPEACLPALREAVTPFMTGDVHGRGYEGRGYTVRSVYLDTPQLRYYEEKKAGIKVRRKLRVRAYNTVGPDDAVLLEIKRKNEAAVRKVRVPVRLRDLEALFASGDVERYVADDARAREEARYFFYHVYRYRLRPTCLTTYEREAFVGRFDPTLRITFDRNLRGRAYPSWADLTREAGLCYVHPGAFVMEVKFNTRFPGWLRPVLARQEFRHQAFSKYCRCLEACRAQADPPTAVLAQACYRTFRI